MRIGKLFLAFRQANFRTAYRYPVIDKHNYYKLAACNQCTSESVKTKITYYLDQIQWADVSC
jgi:hypothetical protein